MEFDEPCEKLNYEIKLLKKKRFKIDIKIRKLENTKKIYEDRLLFCAREGFLPGIIECLQLGADLKKLFKICYYVC